MSPRRQVTFVAVGAAAAAVHYSVAIALLTVREATPQLANFAGWLLAFTVSYAGQALLTFGQQRLAWRTFWRFLATAVSAFALNAGCYAVLLANSTADPRLLLVIAILIAATYTYFLSQSWAFGARVQCP